VELSLRFNAHFPGELGLAGFTEANNDGSDGDNWSYNMCKLQSNHHHQQTDTQLFNRPDALPVSQPTAVSEH